MRWIRRHQLITFFILAYLINYAVTFLHLYWVPLPPSLVLLLQVFSPSISALILSAVIDGWAEIRRLLSGFTRWKVRWKWYLAAGLLLLGPLGIALVYWALGNPIPGPEPGLSFGALLGYVALTFISGPLAEEAGWRGFALPRLQEHYNALISSIILGVLWGFWHVPFYFQPTSSLIPFPIGCVINIALSILLTWMYNNTKGSLVICVLAHFLYNVNGAIIVGRLGLVPPLALYVGGGIIMGLYLVIVVVIFGPSYLSRKPVDELPFRRRTQVQQSS